MPEGRPPLLFLSHAGIDSEAARALKARIEAAPEAREAGLQVWFDKDDLDPGLPWQGQLEEAIERRSTAFAVYLGSKGLVNWVEAEVRLGLSRATRDPAYRFMPIIAAEAAGSSAALPGFARQYQGVRDVENDQGSSGSSLRALLAGAGASGARTGAARGVEEEPFFGLRAIDEDRSHLFFGRERETGSLVQLLRASSWCMVVGDSGSGKSSLVKAGLVPAGAAARSPSSEVGRRPEEAVWHVVQMRPGPPRAELGDAVGKAARRSTSLAEPGDHGGLGRDRAPARSATRCAAACRPSATRMLVVVDQFEELVTAARGGRRAPFAELLLALAEPADERVRVALTMRRDYYNLLSRALSAARSRPAGGGRSGGRATPRTDGRGGAAAGHDRATAARRRRPRATARRSPGQRAAATSSNTCHVVPAARLIVLLTAPCDAPASDGLTTSSARRSTATRSSKCSLLRGDGDRRPGRADDGQHAGHRQTQRRRAQRLELSRDGQDARGVDVHADAAVRLDSASQKLPCRHLAEGRRLPAGSPRAGTTSLASGDAFSFWRYRDGASEYADDDRAGAAVSGDLGAADRRHRLHVFNSRGLPVDSTGAPTGSTRCM